MTTLSPRLADVLHVIVPEFMVNPDAPDPECARYQSGDWYTLDPREARDLAHNYCAKCPFLDACRTHGLTHESFGIWGGVLVHRTRHTERCRDLLAEPW